MIEWHKLCISRRENWNLNTYTFHANPHWRNMYRALIMNLGILFISIILFLEMNITAGSVPYDRMDSPASDIQHQHKSYSFLLASNSAPTRVVTLQNQLNKRVNRVSVSRFGVIPGGYFSVLHSRSTIRIIWTCLNRGRHARKLLSQDDHSCGWEEEAGFRCGSTDSFPGRSSHAANSRPRPSADRSDFVMAFAIQMLRTVRAGYTGDIRFSEPNRGRGYMSLQELAAVWYVLLIRLVSIRLTFVSWAVSLCSWLLVTLLRWKKETVVNHVGLSLAPEPSNIWIWWLPRREERLIGGVDWNFLVQSGLSWVETVVASNSMRRKPQTHAVHI